MTYTLKTEPDLTVEAFTLLEALCNGDGKQKTLDEAIQKNGGDRAEETRALFARAIALEGYVKEKLDYDPAILNFLFKRRETAGNVPAVTFFAYDLGFGRQFGSRLLAALLFSMEDEFSTAEMLIHPPTVNGEGELFEMLESTGLDAGVKYDVMRVYFRFDEYHAHYANIIAMVSALVEDKLPLFAESIEAFRQSYDAVLREKGFAYFHEKYGLTIQNDIDFDIRPLLYETNSIRVGGLPAPYGTRHTLSIGLTVDSITTLCDSVRSVSKFLPDFLKALSDSTKWTILQMLKAEPLYGGQLAERLNLTGATISHHMMMLKELDLILLQKDASKVYYSLNGEKIAEFIKLLGGSF